MFNSYIDERQLPRELFEGPGKPKKNSEGYLFYWTLKPFDKNYPPLQLIAGVSGGFNSDMIITTETLMFFKNECERDRAAGKRELSPFKGFCD